MTARQAFFALCISAAMLLSACELAAPQPPAPAAVPPTEATPNSLPAPTTAANPVPAAPSAFDPFGGESGRESPYANQLGIDLYAEAAPDFPAGLDWLNTDRPLTLAQLSGKVVLIDFWTYGCINCIHNFPDIKRLQQEYPDELVVIGVHSAKFDNESATENIRRVILRYGLEHPIVNDHDLNVWHTWGVRAWPTLVLVDPAGNLAGMHLGEGVYGAFKPLIQSLVTSFDSLGGLDRTPLDLKLESEGLPATVLSFPGKVKVDLPRNRLFIADTNHHRVVVARLPDGEVIEVIGSATRGFADGDLRSASFNAPQGMALSDDGTLLYVADTGNHAVRAVDLEAGQVTTLAGTGRKPARYPPVGGTAPDVALSSPWDLALDGRRLYIAMAGSHQIWVLDLTSGEVAPFAGNALEGVTGGPREQAELAQPSGLAIDARGRLYFADSESSAIRWADPAPGGEVGTLAGGGRDLFVFGDRDGVGQEARLQHPLGVAVDGELLYVADTYNSKIKQVDLRTRAVTTLFGGNHGWRDGTDPLFYEPGGIDVAGDQLFVADTNNHAIRIIDLVEGTTTTLVLKGIERFAPGADDAGYRGTIVRLEPVELSAGAGTVLLDVRLPQGYKVNDLAPYTMEWRVEGEVVTLPADASRSIVAPEFPLRIEATFNPGPGTLVGDLAIIYCEEERESLCLIEQVRIEAPVRVGEAGTNELVLTYAIDLPEEVVAQ